MKRLYVIISIMCMIVLLSTCKKETDNTIINKNPSSTIPVLTTLDLVSVTLNSAKGGGQITSDGGLKITARGVFYSMNTDPTIDGNKTINGIGTGNFTSEITGLLPHTLYYIRAYATNSSGTGYGDIKSFTTDVINTSSSTSVTITTAKSGGTISSSIGFKPTSRGVCWSITDNPTINNDSKTTNGSGTGSFTSIITKLAANTEYHVRAYATNGTSTEYGNQMTFKTKQYGPAVNDVDGNTYLTDTIGKQIWMVENLRVTRFNNGDAISKVTDNSEWRNITTAAYCSYNNDANNAIIYGNLYNLYSANDSRGICPTNWHVPHDADWNALKTYLGGKDIAGGKLKEAGTTHWNDPNTGATNESDFTALPGGYRLDIDGTFNYVGAKSFWWSATPIKTISKAGGFSLDYSIAGDNGIKYYEPGIGFSIRCIKDIKRYISTK